ncbi:MAG: division plane positioning ATPase MipZ [Nitratireductor sp.]
MLGTREAGPRQAYVIVCGNEKGGSGKTTTAMHLVVALLNAGHKVASIDLDSRQKSLTRYIENRKANNRRRGINLAVPDHFVLDRAVADSVAENETTELGQFQDILQQVERTHDFILIDTPGHDSYSMRLAHSMADTLVTPINDSYVDFDVLGQVDPATGEVIDISHYAKMVREARRHRRTVDNGLMDWVVVRNRLSHLTSRNNQSLSESLKDLSMRLGCRLADGISERVVFRELFPVGMTALDEMSSETLGSGPTLSHLSARQEVRSLLNMLKLPIDDQGRRRAQARRMWLDNASRPMEDLGIFAD